jgi:DNA invertase Pin-like site-specific DNA recombinase
MSDTPKEQFVVVYARFSPRFQSVDCVSIERQTEELRDLAKQRGWTIRAEFADADTSGKSPEVKCKVLRLEENGRKFLRTVLDEPEREGLGQALAALQRGDYLLVRDPSRLSRDPQSAATYLRIVENRGARLVTYESGGETAESPMTDFMRDILFAYSKFERRTKRDRTQRRARQKQARGGCAGGTAPYGMMDGPSVRRQLPSGAVEIHRTWVENPAEAPTLAYILQLANQGLKCRRIATRLNREGVPSRGKRWHRERIQAIIDRAARDAKAYTD